MGSHSDRSQDKHMGQAGRNQEQQGIERQDRQQQAQQREQGAGQPIRDAKAGKKQKRDLGR